MPIVRVGNVVSAGACANDSHLPNKFQPSHHKSFNEIVPSVCATRRFSPFEINGNLPFV